MKKLNEWHVATATNGHEIYVKVIPLKRIQNSVEGHQWVEVGKMIQLTSGEEIEFNLDRKSFYTSYNQLYRLN
ncbi:transposase [Acinetobacter sp.]|uniref:transposase n=1 Tax=Acinetobacter sp. TaxID=472 RepID=UPI0031D580AE